MFATLDIRRRCKAQRVGVKTRNRGWRAVDGTCERWRIAYRGAVLAIDDDAHVHRRAAHFRKSAHSADAIAIARVRCWRPVTRAEGIGKCGVDDSLPRALPLHRGGRREVQRERNMMPPIERKRRRQSETARRACDVIDRLLAQHDAEALRAQWRRAHDRALAFRRA